MRPRLTPWYVFGIGLQRTLREPYLDADVPPSMPPRDAPPCPAWSLRRGDS